MSSVVIAEEPVTYPADCDTDMEKREILEEYKDKIKKWHNSQTEDMTAAEARAFFVNEFFPKSKAIESEINRYQEYVLDGDGNYIKDTPTVPEEYKWNPDISGFLNSVSKDASAKKKG
jgi:hypothetical protein